MDRNEIEALIEIKGAMAAKEIAEKFEKIKKRQSLSDSISLWWELNYPFVLLPLVLGLIIYGVVRLNNYTDGITRQRAEVRKKCVLTRDIDTCYDCSRFPDDTGIYKVCSEIFEQESAKKKGN